MRETQKGEAIDRDLAEIFQRGDEIFEWSKAAAYCVYGTLSQTGRADREELVGIALAAAEYCLENGKPIDHYLRLLFRVGCPRPVPAGRG